jgi:hypothetical protein
VFTKSISSRAVHRPSAQHYQPAAIPLSTIEGHTLKAGMYLYTLIADGKEVDTKKMILTK